MATKKRKASKVEAKPRAKPKLSAETKNKKELLMRIHDRFKVMSDADDENRREALEDLKFVNVPGAQWDENMKKERGNRPCYEFNKLRINGKRVINEIRANRPQGKVRSVEGGDQKAAQLREGLCRNIANMSDFDTITDQQAEYQVDAGMGAWRVVTEYSDDTAFDQDILIKPIKNPFCLYADPACQDVLKRDAEDWILTERIANKAYESKYGKAEKISFDAGEFDDEDEWADDETVRVVEYWYKEPYEKEILLVDTPTGRLTVDGSSDEAPGVKAKIAAGEYKLVKSRIARCHRIMMCVASGDAILEGPVERPGSQFPFVLVYGEWKVVDGKVKWHGLHRFSKDAQRSYNVARTSIDETIAQAPQAKYWATPEQAKGHTTMWGEAHKKNFPFLLFNADPKQPGAPQRMGGPEVPVALIQQTMVSSQDIRDTSGLHEASFGEESQEKSGVALARKQHQAQIVTYNFPDNMAKGVKRTWEILLDYIPEIYDTERELRVIGMDGKEDYETVNEIVPGPPDANGMPTSVRVNDMAAGKFDVTVTTGPSYATQGQETAVILSEMAAKSPEIMQVGGDLMLKAMSLATGLTQLDELGDRWKTILPPAIQKQLEQGKEMPPEVAAGMAKVEQAMQLVQQQTQLVQAAAQEVQESKVASEQAKVNAQKVLADIKIAEAQFDANVTKKLAEISIKEAQVSMREAQLGSDEERSKATIEGAGEAAKALESIDGMVAQFMEAMHAAMAKMRAESGVTVNLPQQQDTRPKSAKIQMVNGERVLVPEYEGGQVPEGGLAAIRLVRDEKGNASAVREYKPKASRVRVSAGPDGSLQQTPEF
jgi:hypothetical protein